MSQSLLIRSKILTLPSGRALFTLPPMVAIPSNQVNEHRMLADLELRNYSRVMSQSLLCRSMILLPLLNYSKYLNFATTKRGMFSDASTFQHLRRKLENIYIPRFCPCPVLYERRVRNTPQSPIIGKSNPVCSMALTEEPRMRFTELPHPETR